MLKIGIIGTESKHSELFARLLKEGKFPEVCCGGVWGGDCPERIEYVCSYSGVKNVFLTEEQLISECDAVMICGRYGDRHLKYAGMCAAAKKPFFVDKPFSISVQDAEKIIKAATDSNTLMLGGSTLAFVPEIDKIKNEMRGAGGLWMSFGADPESMYNGYHFYGSHLTDILTTLIPEAPLSVTGVQNGHSVTAVFHYHDGFQAVIQTNPSYICPVVTVLSSKGIKVFPLNDSTCYYYGLSAFTDMIKEKKPPVNYERYLASVKCACAVIESVSTGQLVLY